MEPSVSMVLRLILIGGVYVDPTKIVAVRPPTELEATGKVGESPVRSVLVLDRAVQPCLVSHATPRTAAREIEEWFVGLAEYQESRYPRFPLISCMTDASSESEPDASEPEAPLPN